MRPEFIDSKLTSPWPNFGEKHDRRSGSTDQNIGKHFPGRLFQRYHGIYHRRLPRKHPTRAHTILQGLDFLGSSIDYVLAHHEKMDGTGYPKGITGEQIPLGAKILAVADCFDAITTTRSYQAAKSTEHALKILQKLSGRHLDPSLVTPFIEEIRENGVEEVS